jgi:hypothetical protein
MPVWAAAGVAYFCYVFALALILRPLPARSRVRACTTAVLGLVLCVLSAYVDAFWLRLIVLPPSALLVAYWSGGFLWTGPMERLEQWLVRTDRRLGIEGMAARLPRAVAELLELAYAGIYPLIPMALALRLVFVPSADPDRFWAVILVTDFICFAMLPWIQTRPPRLLQEHTSWPSKIRGFNVMMLGHASIGVNTVPSGHAAEAFAAALLVSGAPWPISVAMWIAALAVSAGAVFGRYHFAVDAIAGWGVALAVWALFSAR